MGFLVKTNKQKGTKKSIASATFSPNRIRITGQIDKNKTRTFNFEIVTPEKISKERNPAYKYFSID